MGPDTSPCMRLTICIQALEFAFDQTSLVCWWKIHQVNLKTCVGARERKHVHIYNLVCYLSMTHAFLVCWFAIRNLFTSSNAHISNFETFLSLLFLVTRCRCFCNDTKVSYVTSTKFKVYLAFRIIFKRGNFDIYFTSSPFIANIHIGKPASCCYAILIILVVRC